MLSFLEKYYFYGILGLIGVLSIIAFEPTLTAWLFRQTAPPIKVYKTVPLEKRENSNQIQVTQRSGAETQNSLEQKHSSRIDGAPTVTEFHQNGNFDNNQASDETTTIETVVVPPPKRRGTSPEALAADKKRRASQRLREIEAEMRALVPHADGNPGVAIRLLDLEEELLRINQERGTLHMQGGNPFISIKIQRLILSALKSDKIPVAIGNQVADYMEEAGNFEHAARLRAVTQRAIESGDEFYKPEHMEGN